MPKERLTDHGSTMQRNIFTSEHEDFRSAVRRFVERDIAPHVTEWEDAGIVPRDAWLAVGKMGMLCPDVPEEYGGPGGDFLFNAIVHEELAWAALTPSMPA